MKQFFKRNLHSAQTDRKLIGFKMTLTCLCMLFTVLTMSANETIDFVQKTISGTVTDSYGSPLPGVNILIEGTRTGAQTDFDGNYTLTASTGDILVFSYIGMKTLKLTIESNSTYNVTLEEDASALDEVIVVGYGTQKKISVTGSVSSLKVEEILKQPSSNVKGLLIGQVPGLVTNQNPGLPGSSNVSLSIRGFGQPLVIVDGIESIMDNIDPNDIESLSVLKDASAAIYGARAGNGVILITTKRGTSGKFTINYHGWTGVQSIVAFNKKSNATNYIQHGIDAKFNTEYDPSNPTNEITYNGNFTPENLEKYKASGETYDWIDAVLKSGGSHISNHNISFRGGTDKVRYYTSLGSLKQGTVFNGDYNYKKLNIINNIDADLSDNLSMQFNSSFIFENLDYALSDISTVWNDLDTSLPIHRTENPDPDRAPYSGFSNRSPVARTHKKWAGSNLQEKRLFTAALDLKYKVPSIEGLTLGTKINFRQKNWYRERLSKSYSIWNYDPSSPNADSEGYVEEADIIGNKFSKAYYSGNDQNGRTDARLRMLYRGYFNYKRDFNDHSIGFLTFAEKEDNKYRSLFTTTKELLSTAIPDVDSSSDENTSVSGTGVDTEYTRISMASRFNYSYANKYLLEATLRADASSKFHSDVRWGYFPSLSLGWNIAQEDFLVDSNTIDELKLRLSFSQTGIDSNISNVAFDYLTGYIIANGSSYLINGEAVTPIYSAGLVNKEVSWETTTLYNVGVDLGLFNRRLSANIDVYYRHRDDILAFPIESVPTTFGASLPLVNLNSDIVKGIDVGLAYKDIIGEDFRYHINGGFGIHKKEWDKFEQDIDITDPFQVKYNQRSGHNKNVTWGYKTSGIFNSQQEVDDYLANYDLTDFSGGQFPKPGDLIYVDSNGDNMIDSSDRVNIGYGTTAEVTFSLNSGFDYKGFSFNMLWQGATNVKITANGTLRAPFRNEQSSLVLHDKYSWRQDPSNPGVSANSNAVLPAFESDGIRDWNNQINDLWVLDATYLRLKSATFGYALPSEVTSKIGFDKLELYLSADNLLTISNLGIFKDGLDPEQANTPGAYSIPINRTVMFGVKLSL
ncbi:MAG: SusC/RagA family TonB-linked outer membrane protein [Flavobacteriaceae bacterium]|nr:MAG: SusC/RagA family TonB-linked outer membrane protein [Flavobacteriaceae bacterium]